MKPLPTFNWVGSWLRIRNTTTPCRTAGWPEDYTERCFGPADLAEVYLKRPSSRSRGSLPLPARHAPARCGAAPPTRPGLVEAEKIRASRAGIPYRGQLKPDWGIAYGDLAVAANEAQDYPLAIKALDARAKFLPEIPVGYFLRATAYDHLRDYQQAAANYHLFLQVADGKYPDQEWQARHRLITIEPKK